ncbi:hypothetical protein L1887_35709 [Cichorium endivia]|nr:hypothetical protein L1887_35709 [Cichorium endivia]
MLQRAASNAFSWWWASHIRTKQSKWLEQSLIDMEYKVQNALNIIQKDGDSFGKRAEMYYRHRPDLICFVEETFRAYRSLAERYDKMSKDLQKANTTIASIFPDQVSYDDFDEFDSPRSIPKDLPPQNQGPNAAKIPKVPQLPSKNLKGLISNASKKIQMTKILKEDRQSRIVPKSGLTEEQALEEIDKIQKEILAMQTMKEFIKSEYENGLSKYWEIENKIKTMQQKVCILEDEFKVGRVIEDGDARTVMAQAALKSCKDTLEKLEDKVENSNQAAKLEHQRIVDAKQKFKALKSKLFPKEVDVSEKDNKGESKISNEDNEKEAMAKFKEELQEQLNKPITVSGLAYTIDKLANKVIGLESTVSSQTATIDKLRIYNGELQTQIQKLEGEKGSDEAQIRKKLKIIETKLQAVEALEKDAEKQNNSLKTFFIESRCNIEYLSEKIHDVQPDDDEVQVYSPVAEEANSMSDDGFMEQEMLSSEEEAFEEVEIPSTKNDEVKNVKNTIKDDKNDDSVKKVDVIKTKLETNDDDRVKNEKATKKNGETNDDDGVKNVNTAKKEVEKKDDGVKNVHVKQAEEAKMENMEEANDEAQKNPLKEYTKTFKNYKETKKKLSEEEQKKLGTLFELIVLVRELKTGMVKKEGEIHMLKQKLKRLQEDVGPQFEENWQEVKQEDKDDEEINILIPEVETISEIEMKLRTDIDVILDENLDFWMRFSSQFHQVQKFKTEIEDLKGEIGKVKARKIDTKALEGKSSESMFTTDLRSDIRPIYRHLKEIQSELIMWIEQANHLKDELQTRCSSLTNIQEEITMALKDGMLEDEIKFSTHQAAKFQGEILNMQQENNRVNEELEAGIEHVRALHLETKKTLRKLEAEFGLSDGQNPYQQNMTQEPSRQGIPLRSFIFGVKAKKQKPSIFGCRKAPTGKGGVK